MLYHSIFYTLLVDCKFTTLYYSLEENIVCIRTTSNVQVHQIQAHLITQICCTSSQQTKKIGTPDSQYRNLTIDNMIDVRQTRKIATLFNCYRIPIKADKIDIETTNGNYTSSLAHITFNYNSEETATPNTLTMQQLQETPTRRVEQGHVMNSTTNHKIGDRQPKCTAGARNKFSEFTVALKHQQVQRQHQCTTNRL